MAQARDRNDPANRSSRRLELGLNALDEAEDFLPDASGQAPIDVEIIVESHRTPLEGWETSECTADRYADLYRQFASAQLGAAVQGFRAGSMALHALGKTYSRSANGTAEEIAPSIDRAMAIQRGALMAEQGNYLAANELGVLLGKRGEYEQAHQMLVRSLNTHRDPSVEQNLNFLVNLMRGAGADARGPNDTGGDSNWYPQDRLGTAARNGGLVPELWATRCESQP